MPKKIVILTLIVSIAGFGYSLFVMYSARNSAIQLSSNEPFCIQVAAARDYKEVETIFDLAGFNMYGGHIKNHAVLVVGNISSYRLYHWSYWGNKFNKGAYGQPPIYCTPHLNFFSRNDTQDVVNKSNVNFVFHENVFSIPKSYSPRVLWPGVPGIMLTARTPTFSPTNGELCSERLCNMVEIHFGILPRLEVWRNINDSQHEVENLGEKFGLTKQRVLTKGSKYSSLQYYTLDENGKVKTLIMCSEEENVQCLHSFYENGISYDFHEMPNDIQNWRTTENTLANLFNTLIEPVK